MTQLGLSEDEKRERYERSVADFLASKRGDFHELVLRMALAKVGMTASEIDHEVARCRAL